MTVLGKRTGAIPRLPSAPVPPDATVNPAAARPPLVRIENAGKAYSGFHALQDITLDIRPGETCGLCGENGAGKSTLIKILTGAVAPTTGAVRVGEAILPGGNVTAAEAAGIAVIHQEPITFGHLNAVENIFVGREMTRAGGLLLDHAAMRREARRLLGSLGIGLDLRQPVGEMSLGNRQMVAVARALLGRCRLLILDEPTASLSAHEARTLLNTVKTLRKQGVSILYVSHRLDEIFDLADRITVLRDGRLVATRDAATLDHDGLVDLMVGRTIDLTQRHAGVAQTESPPTLSVQSLTSTGQFADISFAVRPGEVVAMAGLIGAGRSEVAEAVAGLSRYDSGQVTVAGQPLRRGSVTAAMRAGVALVPEDRHRQGLVTSMSVADNLVLAVLRRLTTFGLIRNRRAREVVNRAVTRLGVKAPSTDVPAAALSGGNQQKIVIGKWLATEPQLLILDEPTRGVDVGAKAEIYARIRELTRAGVAVLVISSDLLEVLHLADRILVMRGGRIVGELEGAAATESAVLSLAVGGETTPSPWEAVA